MKTYKKEDAISHAQSMANSNKKPYVAWEIIHNEEPCWVFHRGDQVVFPAESTIPHVMIHPSIPVEETDPPKEVIVLPNLLLNPAYYQGLDDPVESIAEALDEADRPFSAMTVRDLRAIAQAFYQINIAQTHTLFIQK